MIENSNAKIYIDNGFSDRHDYLDSLADEYGQSVFDLAELLGMSEDFDGLVTSCEDMMEY